MVQHKPMINIMFLSMSALLLQSCVALSPTTNASANKNIRNTGEVVGATGRIGSFLVKSDDNFAAVARKERPGSLTDEGCPIFVSVPATQISNVIERTLPKRRNDLVFVTNGIPSDFLDIDDDDLIDENEITVTVPYFGVLGVGEEVVTSDTSPQTIISEGRHGRKLAEILESSGISCDIVDGVQEVDRAAIQKLIWASITWLLCHDCEEGEPITCAGIHERKSEEVYQLVQELVPAANSLLAVYLSPTDKRRGIGSIAEVAKHLEDYNLSIPDAIPAKALAIDEFELKNGYLLSMEGSAPQPIHRKLVQSVVGYIPELSSPAKTYSIDHLTPSRLIRKKQYVKAVV